MRQSSKLSQKMPTRMDGAMDASVTSRGPLPRQQQESEVRKQADRTDAQWAEMQSTLEEVELSAASGTHVFGADHAKALEGLRMAQIELAKAWARSEADDALESADKESKGMTAGGKGLQLGSEGRSFLDAAGSTVHSGSARPGSSAGPARVEKATDLLEQETEHDILLARKRREANDKYFQIVNEGVLDVVTRLEQVAYAMRAVEQESRDIWGETESSRASVHDSY